MTGLLRVAANGHFHRLWLIATVLVAGAVGCEAIKSNSVTVPVSIYMRGSMVGMGNVLVVKNTSQRTVLNVTIRIENRNGQSMARQISTFDPGEVFELGWTDGWTAERGEKVTVSADGFLPAMSTL